MRDYPTPVIPPLPVADWINPDDPTIQEAWRLLHTPVPYTGETPEIEDFTDYDSFTVVSQIQQVAQHLTNLDEAFAWTLVGDPEQGIDAVEFGAFRDGMYLMFWHELDDAMCCSREASGAEAALGYAVTMLLAQQKAQSAADVVAAAAAQRAASEVG